MANGVAHFMVVARGSNLAKSQIGLYPQRIVWMNAVINMIGAIMANMLTRTPLMPTAINKTVIENC